MMSVGKKAVRMLALFLTVLLFDDDQFHLVALEMADGHSLGKEYLEYMWQMFLEKKDES